MLVMEITQSYLDELIFTPKRITIKPERNYQVINGSNRKNFELVSDKYNERFRVFIRQNVTLPEIYSIGLQLINNNFEENPILFRCNGPHGGNKSIPEHFVTHIHHAQLISVDIGLFGIEKLNEACGEFSTLESAIYYFCNTCNILDARTYFPECWEVPLFN